MVAVSLQIPLPSCLPSEPLWTPTEPNFVPLPGLLVPSALGDVSVLPAAEISAQQTRGEFCWLRPLSTTSPVSPRGPVVTCKGAFAPLPGSVPDFAGGYRITYAPTSPRAPHPDVSVGFSTSAFPSPGGGGCVILRPASSGSLRPSNPEPGRWASPSLPSEQFSLRRCPNLSCTGTWRTSLLSVHQTGSELLEAGCRPPVYGTGSGWGTKRGSENGDSPASE